MLHNYFFPDTAYKLLGFKDNVEHITSVVQQPYVRTNETTNLQAVKLYLESNGFRNKRNNDYFNSDLGIILEDLHDKNVITSQGVMFFIDTTFYLTDAFFQDAI